MNIKKLNLRVTFTTYGEVEEVDGSGTYKTWQDIATVWAHVKPVKGLVRFDTKQIGEEITHKVITRFFNDPNITTEHWIRFRDKHFRIRSVTNVDEANRYYEFMCMEDSELADYFEANIDAAGDPLEI